MMTLNTIIKIATNKTTYIILFLTVVVIIIFTLLIKLNNYKNKTEKLNSEIENLKTTNYMLEKENNFKSEQIKIISTFTNSTMIIEKIKNKDLSYEERASINAISNDFYNYFLAGEK